MTLYVLIKEKCFIILVHKFEFLLIQKTDISRFLYYFFFADSETSFRLAQTALVYMKHWHISIHENFVNFVQLYANLKNKS